MKKILQKIKFWFVWNFKTKPLIDRNCDEYDYWLEYLRYDEEHHLLTEEERKIISNHMESLMLEIQ